MLTERDYQRLAGCHPDLVTKLEAAFDAVYTRTSFHMFVVNGVRTDAEQQALYAQGRTTPGPHAGPLKHLGDVVTFKDGVTHKSDHQPKADGYGHAADCAFTPIATREDPFDKDWPWEVYAEALEAQGLQAGARWKMADLDHAQLA